MEITWNITDMKRDITGIVKIIYYSIAAKDADSNYEDVYNFTINVRRKSDSPEAINYEDLTQEQVIAWVKNKLGQERVTKIENRLTNKSIISKSKNNNLNLETGLPW
jgi:hypothetical protein